MFMAWLLHAYKEKVAICWLVRKLVKASWWEGVEYYLEVAIVGMGLRPMGGIWPMLTLDDNNPWIPFLVQCMGEDLEACLEEVKRNIYLLKDLTR